MPSRRYWEVDADPAWAPDGRRLAFTRQVSELSGAPADRRDVLIAGDLSSSTPRIVPILRDTSPEGRFGALAWSPDGRYLAVNTRGSEGPGLYAINVATHARRLLLRGYFDSASWSPSGVALIASVGNDRIIRLDLRTGRVKTIGRGDGVRYSPDGTRIAFLSQRDHFGTVCRGSEGPCDPSKDVYVMDVNGGSIRRVTHTAADESTVTWIADDRLVVDRTTSLSDPSLYSVGLTGIARRLVTRPASERPAAIGAASAG